MEASFTTYYPSPIGLLEISSTGHAVTAVSFVEAKEKVSSLAMPACLNNCVAQLNEYFRGARKDFDIPLLLEGTSFQQQVWNELSKIPFGKTTSYLAIARKMNNPNAVRAIGNTNSRNKICILLPCHPVIGQDGSLVGYADGLWRKKWMLAHEQTFSGFGQMVLF